jgi:hypothetical protein
MRRVTSTGAVWAMTKVSDHRVRLAFGGTDTGAAANWAMP